MKARELSLDELLERSPLGPLEMLGQRVLLMDAVALGLFRKELFETLGPTATRGIFVRFGFAHGYRAAQALEHALPWDEPREWRIAGAQIHRIQGLVIPDVPKGEEERAFAVADWSQSYEAEQHLLFMGPAREPVCWSLCGFASGYLSYAHKRQVYAVEERCVACGDPHCRMIARFAEDWGSALETVAAPYGRCALEASLARIVTDLKSTERALDDKKRALDEAQRTPHADGSIIVASVAMRRVLELVARVARTDTTVLITGESGVGKERIARMLHAQSTRSEGPFLAINCGAITETLLESELFGHKRGAFTGASADRAGLFEAAQGGTLLLDEVGELSPSLQVKLLRVLQEREVRRVGENKPRPIDARVVAATHRDLRSMVAAGTFREDLYYRLRVIEVPVPPLRARRDDVLAIARSVLVRSATRLGRDVVAMTPRAADALARYPWPGNVRELENAIERAVVLADGPRIDVDDLPEEVRSNERLERPATIAGALVGQTLAEAERTLILATLAANDGHQGRTAAQLGIGTATLYRKLKDYSRA
ncbi:MAG: sigma-54-dependent Fis family transcriptional regulator [Myxococcales bacterium]|nr:sigma-54-dependent Fis family transcriptional regulator [Myxococcales bacterium]